MSLEDDLRRMGDARAAQAEPADWRRREAVSVTGRWLITAAAVLVLVIGGIALFVTGDESPDVAVDEPDPEPAEEEPEPEPADSAQPADPDRTPCMPDNDVLDAAVQLAPDRTPLDLDSDGIDDEVLAYEDPGGGWILVARLADGWTESVTLGGTAPMLMSTPDGIPSGRDLDRDGDVEFFVDDQATSYLVVSLPACGTGEPLAEVIAANGEWCIPPGGVDARPEGPYDSCEWRIACAGQRVIVEAAVPGGDFEGRVNRDEVAWTRRAIDVGAETIETVFAETSFFSPDDPPLDPPTAAHTGVVDCSPGADPPIAEPAPCDANPAPTEAVLDVAQHLAFDRSPLDLDQDGVGDELLGYPDPGGEWWVIARLQHGWTTPAFVGTRWPPELVERPRDAGPSHADLDRDGQLEFFVTAFGNTARNAALISLTGCDLVRVDYRDEPASEPSSAGLILVGVGGGSCRPNGCWPRVGCPAPTELHIEIAEPGPGGEMVWTRTAWRLVDGLLVERTSRVVEFDPADWPVLAPGPDDSDVVDCSR